MFGGILAGTLPISTPTTRSFSSVTVLSSPNQIRLQTLIFNPPSSSPRTLTIRMGGGPRTYPGGVSKWQWKRMQTKKGKQLLKARLCRERQLYEMRKRAELKAAVAQLEKPWEVVERAPTLFSVNADEQVKALADRFQKPGGFDMWTERDGPQVFRTPDGLPSARFFPKGVVHSVKPYGIVPSSSDSNGEELVFDDWISRGGGGVRRSLRRSSSREGEEASECIDTVIRDVVDGDKNRVQSRRSMKLPGEEEGTKMVARDAYEKRNGKISSFKYRDNERNALGVDSDEEMPKFRHGIAKRRGRVKREYVLAEFKDSIDGEKQVNGNGKMKSSRSSKFSRHYRNEEDDAVHGEGNASMKARRSWKFSRHYRNEKDGDLVESSSWTDDIEVHYARRNVRSDRNGSHGSSGNRWNRRGTGKERSFVSDSEMMVVCREEKNDDTTRRGRFGRTNRRYGAERASR